MTWSIPLTKIEYLKILLTCQKKEKKEKVITKAKIKVKLRFRTKRENKDMKIKKNTSLYWN